MMRNAQKIHITVRYGFLFLLENCSWNNLFLKHRENYYYSLDESVFHVFCDFQYKKFETKIFFHISFVLFFRIKNNFLKQKSTDSKIMLFVISKVVYRNKLKKRVVFKSCSLLFFKLFL